MPIFLPAPAHQPTGPDGQGWNRLTVAAPAPSAQCALRPRTYAALAESQDTRLRPLRRGRPMRDLPGRVGRPAQARLVRA